MLLFLSALWPAVAAEITVPNMEMASRGRVEDKEFVLSSVISADLALTGGYKYSFLLGLSLEADDIARAFAYRNFRAGLLDPADPVSADEYNALANRLNNQAFIGFRLAKATARDLFGLPLEMSYFFGSGDNFCTGDEFPIKFGISPFGTDFRGFYYFPEGIGGIFSHRYNGIHGVRGTGLSFSLTKWEKIVPMFYIYQNFADFWSTTGANYYSGNIYSGDLRLLLYHDWLRIDAFGGISLNSSLDTNIRGGLMVHILGNGVEFFAQGGIPGWTTGEKFSIDNIFFLIEPRVHIGLFGINLTFFYHPAEYNQIITIEEKGKADINIKFTYGKADSGFAGGIEMGAEFKVDKMQDIVFRLSPFASFITGGLKWDAKIRIIPQNYDVPLEMMELFIGVRTAF